MNLKDLNNTDNSPHFYPPKPEGHRSAALNTLSSFLFYISILLFIIAFNFRDNPLPFGWYQQFMPNIGGRQIQDITFLDSLTGYATARQTGDTSYVLKTTDGGDTWQIIFRNFFAMTQIQFLNVNTGYACGAYLYKTTNGGFNWSQITAPAISPEELFVLNEDTIWIISSDSFAGGVYFTTNGGVNWIPQLSAGSNNPDRIYMYNRNFGFANRNGGSFMYRTTNGGQNWLPVAGTDGFSDIYFADTLLGWKCFGNMKKSTDGGLNWVIQTIPSGGSIINNAILNFSNINIDTIWGSGGYTISRGILYRSTNQGSTWYYQVPDTSIHIGKYDYVNFVDKLWGWGNTLGPTEIHTVTGGDTNFLLPVKQISSQIPKYYKLFQNYPNPFNPHTNIKYQITVSLNPSKGGTSGKAFIKLTVYDITGKELIKLVNEEQSAGTYETEFDGSGYSSGIYFYSLIVDGILIDTRKMILIK